MKHKPPSESHRGHQLSDTLVYEYIDCMESKSTRDRSKYGANLAWATRSELQKAFCLHVAGLYLRGEDLVTSRLDPSKRYTWEEHIAGGSWRDHLELGFGMTFDFKELGAPEWDHGQKEADSQFSDFIDAVLQEDRSQVEYWSSIIRHMKKLTSFSQTSPVWG